MLSAAAQPRVSWPGRPWQWRAGGVLFSLPLIALAVWASRRGFVSGQLEFVEHRAALVRAGGPGLRGLGFGYPPLLVLLALALPGGTLTLAIVTCVCSGAALALAAQRLLQRFPLAASCALLATFAAVPAMWYAASELLAPVASLALLAIAVDGFVRFTAYGQTDGGFTAGIALAMSFCFDPGALLYGVVMCAFAPLLTHARYRGEPAATRSIAAVLLFPLIGVIASWLFLVWKFTGSVPGSLSYTAGAHLLAFPGGMGRQAVTAGLAAVRDLAHVPLYLAAGVVLCQRRPAAAVSLILPVLALSAALWLGFAYSPVTAYLMLTLLALVIVTNAPVRRLLPLLTVAAICQIGLAVAWPPAAPSFAVWLHAVT